GGPVSDGTYFYVLSLTNCSGTETFTGDIFLLGGLGKKKCDPPANTSYARIHKDDIINNNSTWNNQVHFIEGTLTIPSGKKLTIINSQLKFEEGASIVVERGARLIIQQSTLAGCGQARWGGIEVRGDAGLKQSPQNQGDLKLINSLVRDASIGVFAGKFDDLTPSLDPSYGGGKVHLMNNEMINNSIHVVLSKYDGFKNNSAIEKNRFGTVNQTNFLASDRTHVLILENNDVKIKGNNFEDGAIGLDLRGNSNFKISGNTFDNTEIAVSTESTKADKKSEITDNVFNNSLKAIQFRNDDHSNLQIECNDFNNFQEYAVDSKLTLLQDQGNPIEGCGNLFISGSTFQYDCLNHTGSNLQYYHGPSNAQTLSGSNGAANIARMSPTITTTSAIADGKCNSNSAGGVSKKQIGTNLTDKHPDFTVQGVKIYPNPNSGIFTLSIQTEDRVIIYITNVMGELIYQSTLTNSDKRQIDLSHHAKGVYFVKVVSGKNILVKKIIHN
ncbi:MAG: T9SS type A sorting domain-containing protein, partial [Flavobacteriales bacterium]|nr:T9SS type A sorting domain-containing protein [Flavobacteriales bacterium]